MTRSTSRQSRKGAVLVLVVICLIPLIACVALAVDLGMIAVARTQCQNAADAVAMAGARVLNGNVADNNNFSNVAPKAQTVGTANQVLSTPISGSQIQLDIGRYTYVTNNNRFEGQFPGPATDNWSMVRATVTSNVQNQMAFSRIFNFVTPNIQAVATAAHRPRDIAIILDFSGSMRYDSLMGTPTSGTSRVSNNMDSDIPTFGHYSAVSTAALKASSPTSGFGESNVSVMSSDQRPPVIPDFYTDAVGTPAFTKAPSSYGATPLGDNHPKSNKNQSTSYAQTVAQLLNISNGSVTNSTRDNGFESEGYLHQSMMSVYNGYTVGPGYWGKTFFIWPPDPRPTMDWRRLFFTFPGASASEPVDNTRLWDSSGNWRTPSNTTYQINYAAILAWLKSGPNPFPSRLQSGRILYYDAIPDTINTSSFPPSDMNQRFWKDYIDYVLGVMQTSSSNWTIIQGGSAAYVGYGRDYTWGTIKITASSTLVATGNPPKKPYMHYLDNPKRPKMHFWFGPLSMVDFLGCYNLWSVVSPSASRFCWWPGTCHESPAYAQKLGIRAALNDIQSNHPNDSVSLIFFSVPMTSSGNDSGGRFNRVRVPLGRNYTLMDDALWYPPSTLGNPAATVRPYASDNLEVPRAYGGTCYSMPLMLAYNQFSGNSALKTFNPGGLPGDAGGNGRRGAQKIVIFETDGAPNTTASANFSNQGSTNSYYQVRFNSSNPNASDYPTSVGSTSDNSSSVVSQITTICGRIAALETANPSGFSTPTKPVQIHCIGFGSAFEPGSSSRAANLATLNQMQVTGNVTDNMPSYKICVGTEAQMINNLQQAITTILQSGVQISLIQ